MLLSVKIISCFPYAMTSRLKMGACFVCCTTGNFVLSFRRIWKESTKHAIYTFEKKNRSCYTVWWQISVRWNLFLKYWKTGQPITTAPLLVKHNHKWHSVRGQTAVKRILRIRKEWICIYVYWYNDLFFYTFMHVLQPTNEKKTTVSFRKGKWLEKNNLTEIFALYQTIHILIQSSSSTSYQYIKSLNIVLYICVSFLFVFLGLNIFAGLVINYHWFVSKDRWSI